MKVVKNLLYAKIEFIPKLPINLKPDSFQENLILSQAEANEITHYIYKDGFLNSYGVVLSKVLVPQKTTVYPNRKIKPFKYFISSFKSLISGKVKREEDPISLFHHPWYNNYYHWLIEMLPRFFALHQEEKNLLIALHESAPGFCSQSLKIFNIKQPLLLKDGHLIHFKQLHFASFQDIVIRNIPVNPGSYYVNIKAHTAMLGDMVEQIKNVLDLKETKSFRKIFISRESAGKRKIMNENELREILIINGFEIVKPEHLSFADQVKLFSETKVVIGPNGAGFANIIFMNKDSVVVNLMDKLLNEWCYLSLSQIFNLKYYQINCNGSQDGTAWSRDINVDIQELKGIIGQIEK